MDASEGSTRRHEYSKDIIFNTLQEQEHRRSAISTSEFGLYSDHSDYYYNTAVTRSQHSATARKFAIGIMVVVSVLLIGIFLYDFASSASISSKASQETKHIYILQNPLRKPNFASRKTSAPPIQNLSHVEDRSDLDARVLDYKEDAPKKTDNQTSDPELRSQNLNNFKLRSLMLGKPRDEFYDIDGNPLDENQMLDNHAMIYRMRYNKQLESATPPSSSEILDGTNPPSATPFHFELKGPHPSSFKRPKYPQLSQYRNPHASHNIQDIIKYLTNDPETLNRGIKFTGYYVNPKKYDPSQGTEIGVVNGAGEEDQQESSPPFAVADPLFQYKPKHPTDVNLLATSNFRFSPVGVQRYNPYFDPYYSRLNQNKHSMVYQDNQFDGAGGFSSHYGKKRRPKPFSVMLDIYPITETEQTKKSSKLKPQFPVMDDPNRPLVPYFARYPKLYNNVQSQEHQLTEDADEKHQMILHLNLYPKRKNKYVRDDTIDRTTIMSPDEKTQLIDKLMVPFNALTKHLRDHAVIEEAKLDEREDKYEMVDDGQEAIRKIDAEPTMATTTSTTTTERIGIIKNIDTFEGFQKFADSLIATD